MGSEGRFFSTTATISSSCSPSSTSKRDLGPKWHHNSCCRGLETEIQRGTITRPALGLTSCFSSKSAVQRTARSQRENSFHPLKCAYHITRKGGLDTVIKVNSGGMGWPFKQKDEFYNLNHLWPGACRSKLNAQRGASRRKRGFEKCKAKLQTFREIWTLCFKAFKGGVKGLFQRGFHSSPVVRNLCLTQIPSQTQFFDFMLELCGWFWEKTCYVCEQMIPRGTAGIVRTHEPCWHVLRLLLSIPMLCSSKHHFPGVLPLKSRARSIWEATVEGARGMNFSFVFPPAHYSSWDLRLRAGQSQKLAKVWAGQAKVCLHLFV